MLKYIAFLFIFLYSNEQAAQSFIDETATTGVTGSFGYAAWGGGISFVDFNLDGLDDLTFSSAFGDSLVFYKNLGNGTFQKLPALVTDTQLKRTVLWVDYDNDSDLDLFLTTHPSEQTLIGGQNKLYKNTGNLILQDVTNSCGLLIRNDDSFGAVFADYENDGDLDLFVSNRAFYPNTFYKNLGNGTFQDVSSTIGISTGITADMCAAFFDVENDNSLELLTIVDKYNEPNLLYKKNGTNNLIEVSTSYWDLIADTLDAMNAGIGDFNNDGFMDIYISNTEGGNRLLYNIGGTYFQVYDNGVEVNQTSWGASWLDADNDKDLDLYVSVERGNNAGWASKFFKNNGDETFATAEVFPNDTLNSFCNAIADYNGDGKIDIAVNNSYGDGRKIWKNQISNSNHYVKIKLNGVQSNKFAIGARLVLYSGGTKQTRMIHCGINYMGQNSHTVQFGTGSDLVIDSLKIYWPFGSTDVFYNLGVDQTFFITENQCLNHSYVGGNTAVNKYIGTNGNLMQASNWSRGHIPNIREDVLIQNTTTTPINLTNSGVLSMRSIEIKGPIIFTNNDSMTLSNSFTHAILVQVGATFINNKIGTVTGQININNPCEKAIIVHGNMQNKGVINLVD
jgi:hypothetical protein